MFNSKFLIINRIYIREISSISNLYKKYIIKFNIIIKKLKFNYIFIFYLITINKKIILSNIKKIFSKINIIFYILMMNLTYRNCRQTIMGYFITRNED